MLGNNIGNRERMRIQILFLQVMQQGTRANLCKLASCRLFISFPISLALCSRKIGEKEGGGGGNEGRGVWSEWRDEKELRTLSIFLRLIFTLTNENVH